MKENLNFYENIDEARIRLRNTIVCYDGEPYKVLALANHKDGIIRLYMRSIAIPFDRSKRPANIFDNFHIDSVEWAAAMDKWLDTEAGKQSDIIRKMMNSPKFNKYRPFPLGMCNHSSGCVYIERVPNRKTEQGLIQSMTVQTTVSVDRGGRESPMSRSIIDINSPDFRNCVVGEYPTPESCLKNLKDPEIINNAAAFHREFALVRGPMNMLFLGYRDEIIGLLPQSDFSAVRLGLDFHYTKEAVADLKLFNDIQLA